MIMGGLVAKHGPQLLLSALSFCAYKSTVINILSQNVFLSALCPQNIPGKQIDIDELCRGKQKGMENLSENEKKWHHHCKTGFVL